MGLDSFMETVPIAAKRLGVTRQWLARLVKNGRIKGAKKGFGGYLVPADLKLDAVKAKRKEGAK